MSFIETFKILNEAKVVSFPNATGNFIAVLGAIGSGKSTIKKFLNLRTFKDISSDRFVELYGKKNKIDLQNPDNTYMLHKKLVDPSYKIADNIIENNKPENVNLVWEITGRDLEGTKAFIDMVKNKGFLVTVVLVITSENVAIKRNSEREERQVNPEHIRYANREFRHNITKLGELGDHVWIFNNNMDSEDLMGIRKSNSITQLR